ncbi:MAG: AmmeMemoRadiSam system protein B [Deltaproteobacteria bacterium]|jgi:AmmeMemoRadiSam system protein B|nr:AmmeMemoRadiSam system protein B [Deltaproteobacteria bacterium]
MNPRRTYLDGQWYPATAEKIGAEIQGWADYINQKPCPAGQVAAVIVPHAGWCFSGKLAARTLARAALNLKKPPDLTVVLGGHLPAGNQVVGYGEEAWATPLGPFLMDPANNDRLGGSLKPFIWSGPTDDNTIEVLLPLVKYYFPRTKLWALRVPPSETAVLLGRTLAALIQNSEEKILIVASTDLTHYGRAYGFAPAGSGPEGEKFRQQNDRSFIEASLALDTDLMLKTGRQNRAACSAGAAMAAVRAVSLLGGLGWEVDSYGSSDIMPGPQCVGYAGLEFTRP